MISSDIDIDTIIIGKPKYFGNKLSKINQIILV